MIVPEDILKAVPAEVCSAYLRWAQYMYDNVSFSRPESKLHAMEHCERVLLFALLIGRDLFPDDEDAVAALAQASIFHDTCRLDDYLDRGHGARAAVYFREYCAEHLEMHGKREAEYMMRYHDQDDADGDIALSAEFGDRGVELYHAFKDADALDRWRLGGLGLDPKYLRTAPAVVLVNFAKELVERTVDSEFLSQIDKEVRRTMNR